MNLIYEYAPVTGLLFFFIVFLWVAFQAYRPSAKQRMQRYALIPLTEERNHE